MFDLILRGGLVVGPTGTVRSDIGIAGGKIAAVEPLRADVEAGSTIDAAGLHILPGFVDAHVHLREPGLVHKEGFLTGTQAAAAGGVTTVMVMPTDEPLTLTPEAFITKRELAARQCYVDFALQAGLGPDFHQVAPLAELGAVSFEIFLADISPKLLIADAETLLAALTRIAEVGAIAGITPGDHDVVTKRTLEIRKQARGLRQEFPPTRPPISEALGVARACLAAHEAGARVHLRQISCEASVRALECLRSGAPISSEVTPHHLTLDETELEKQGPTAKVAPPLRPRSDVKVVREALRNGVISIAATDHAPHLPAEKDAGIDDIWKAPSGLPGLQTFLPVMLSLVDDGLLSLDDLVRICAFEPARLFGLEKQKGKIVVGADADLLVLDRRKSMIVRNEDQHSKAKSTPFHGLTVKGHLMHVLLRGKEVARNGQIVGKPSGIFLKPSNS